MANTNWTPAQRHAMETSGHNLLLSAAAGSGKTATLTARIIQSLTDPEHPADISRMLIVTFTRSAAGELKSRISAALSEALAADPGNRRLTDQLIRLGSASICTIDAFCLSLVRANFQHLSLSPGFRLADETELATLRHTLMEDLIDEYYDKKSDGSFATLAEYFVGLKDSDRLCDILENLYEKVINYPEGLTFLENCAAQYEQSAAEPFLNSLWGNRIKKRTAEQLSLYSTALKSSLTHLESNEKLRKAYYPAFLSDVEQLNAMLSALECGTYEEIRSLLEAYVPQKLGPVRKEDKTDEAQIAVAIRKAFIDHLTRNILPFFALSEEKIAQTMKQTADVCRQLFGFLSDYDTRLNAEMSSRNVCDFSGIRRLAYRLLVLPDGSPTATAAAVAERYDAVYIDEYQDVDEIQDAIFSAVAKPGTRFMVGDIKQSIYGFRGAEPAVFAGYRRAYPLLFPHTADTSGCDNIPGETIFMSENFRCDRHVIDFTNAVCSYLFAACKESIGYVPEDDLICAKKTPESVTPIKVKLAIFLPPEKKQKEGQEKAESAPEPDTVEKEEIQAEAAFICSEINEMLQNGHKNDGKPILPGDIAILTRSASHGRMIADVLENAGIPVSTSAEKDFFENPEILLMLSLLNAIDNPTRDISLAAVLRSPLYRFTMDDLVLIRHRTPDTSLYDAVTVMAKEENTKDPLAVKCTNFLRKLDYYRTLSQALPVDKLLQILYQETGIMAYAGGDKTSDGVSVRTGRTNLQRLYEYARRFESGSFRGLYNFIRYIDGILEQGTRIEFGGGAEANAVCITTIHKSKGLEFPVCFVSACGSYFNDSDQHTNTLLFDRRLGLALRLPDESGFARLDTPMRREIAAGQQEYAREEEMRILYVALTRARERLYITAKSRSSEEKMAANAALRATLTHRSTLLTCHSYLDWILAALASGRGRGTFEMTCYPAGYVFSVQEAQNAEDSAQNESTGMCEETIRASEDFFRQQFSYQYPFRHLTNLPSKISVSILRPDILDTLTYAPSEEEKEADWMWEEDSLRLSLIRDEQNKSEEERKWSEWADKTLSRTPVFTDTSVIPLTSAQKGTATHLFLQFCDFERTYRSSVRDEAARLAEQRFLPRALAAQINIAQLEKFFHSDFYDSLSRAKQVWREKRFYLRLPAADFTADTEYARELAGEYLVIQGVIDLFFEDATGKIILCDYKTDALSAEEMHDIRLARAKLSKRHSRQLSYYARALTAILGRAPDRTVIYSLPLGREIDIDITV